MTTFVFRNQTVEPFFGYDGMAYSGYGDISVVPADADRYIWFYQVPVNADSGRLAEELDSYRDRLDLVLLSVDSGKQFIVFTLVNTFVLRLAGNETAVAESVAEFNRHAARLAMSRPNVKLVDFSEFTSRYDAATLIDWKFYLMSQTLLNPKLARDFQAWWQRVEGELALMRKKCLVLDLDNTLWGGVLGEDGIDGIKLGGDYPGKAYTYWQQALLQLSGMGVILAVCSKNNEADVLEAWSQNPNMVLRGENFSARRINWQDKATNLRELAAELNIGLDSMVFVDDNPAERELIRQMLPQVEVPDFPAKPYQLMPFFKQLVEKYFRIYQVTAEDRAKAEQYRANAMRQAEQSRFADMESYLYSLDLQLDIMPADSHNLPRIAQMTQKTNQFNLTTRRYDEADVRQRLEAAVGRGLPEIGFRPGELLVLIQHDAGEIAARRRVVRLRERLQQGEEAGRFRILPQAERTESAFEDVLGEFFFLQVFRAHVGELGRGLLILLPVEQDASLLEVERAGQARRRVAQAVARKQVVAVDRLHFQGTEDLVSIAQRAVGHGLETDAGLFVHPVSVKAHRLLPGAHAAVRGGSEPRGAEDQRKQGGQQCFQPHKLILFLK